MNKGYIYKIEAPSGNVYIGQTIDWERRKKQHEYSTHNPNATDYDYPVHRAMRKYKTMMKFNVIAEVKEEEMNDVEIAFIEEYDSYHGEGYNQTPGGDERGEETQEARAERRKEALINMLLEDCRLTNSK